MTNWRAWLKDRFGWGPIHKATLGHRVSRVPWYYGNGTTLLVLLTVLVLTGAFMALTYSPGVNSSHASVRYLSEQQWLGWFVRGLHYWSAGLMVISLLLHVFRQILVGGYKSPREGTWLVGVLLFFLVIVMSFTGYVLRWDERAIYALRVALHMFSRVPFIGEELVIFVQGGTEPNDLTLSRLFAVHVIIVPLLLLLLVTYHLYLVILHGVTSRRERQQPIHSVEQQRKLYDEQACSDKEGETYFPDTMKKTGAMAAVFVGTAVALTLIVGPRPLQPEANLTEPSFPAEEWWFAWYSALIALLPNWMAPAFVVLFPIVLFLVLVLIPFIDRSPYRGIRKRPLAAASVVICAAALLYLSDLRRRSPWTGWPDATPPPVPAGVQLTAEAEEGRLLFAQYGCNSCHAVSGHGRRVGPDLAVISGRLSRAEYREYILRPPRGVAMPPYEGRLTESELERIIDFVHAAQTFPRR